MNYASQNKIRSKSLNSSTDQEQIHQQTLDYLQKELKEVSAANQPQIQKFKMINPERLTPLEFKLSLGSHGYLVSYKKNQCVSSVIKIIVLVVVCGLMTIPLFYYTQLSQKLRAATMLCMYSVPILYTLLFFLDPGTVFEDQQQTFSEERIFCLTCQIYRNISTKHCSFCNRCCKKYDHHCSVFGKCIGKRNLLFFYLFIIGTSLTFILYFIASIGELYGQFNTKSTKV